MTITTKAAVCWEIGQPWSVEELQLDDPRPTEVLIKLQYAGLCHSDDHNITGDFPAVLPVVGGHEGAGTVVAVGDRVTRVKAGDSVFVTATPSCGVCKFCLDGRGWICDQNAFVMSGVRPDGSAKFRSADGRDVGSYTQLGTFSQHAVVDETQVVPYDAQTVTPAAAALISCGVITGWGSAVKAAEVRPGDVVALVGVGGVGHSAVQGARNAGARAIVAVDPVQLKRESALKFGATHTAESVDAAVPIISGLTGNVMADSVIITVGVLNGELIGESNKLLAKGGRLVTTSVARFDDHSVPLPISEFSLSGKSWVGNVFGRANRNDIAHIVELTAAGQLDIDSMITKEYTLDEINEGYRDMHDGLNVRGVIRF